MIITEFPVLYSRSLVINLYVAVHVCQLQSYLLLEDNITEEQSSIFKRLNHQVKRLFWQFSSHLTGRNSTALLFGSEAYGHRADQQSVEPGNTWCQVPNSLCTTLLQRVLIANQGMKSCASSLFSEKQICLQLFLLWLARDSINAQSSCHCSSLKENVNQSSENTRLPPFQRV